MCLKEECEYLWLPDATEQHGIQPLPCASASTEISMAIKRDITVYRILDIPHYIMTCTNDVGNTSYSSMISKQAFQEIEFQF